MFVTEYLGVDSLSNQAQYYVKVFLFIQSFSTFLLVLSNTFFVLYSIDRIGVALTSITFSFSFLVQLLLDYPSGSLGDWIGQRWVLVISFSCYGLAFLLLPIAQSFIAFMVIAFINGLGNAQNSGALETWFDNNYQVAVEDSDPDRKIYGFSRSRVLTMTRIASALAFLIGGYFATTISRQFVFILQGILCIGIIFIILYTIKDISEEEKFNIAEKKTIDTSNGFFTHFILGLKFLLGSRASFFFIMGTGFLYSTFSIWGGLILIPLYFGYSGSDDLASFLRTFAFLVGIPISIYIAKLSSKIKEDKVPHLTFLAMFLLFPGFIILTTIIPPINEFNLIGCIFTVVILTSAIPTMFDLSEILRQRVMIDLVPSENRNAIYSLIPTIVSVLGIFQLPLAGVLIEDYGLTAGIIAAFSMGLIASIFITIGIIFHKKRTQFDLESTRDQAELLMTSNP